MRVKIIASQEVLFDGEAREVVLPGEDGEFGVLDFHQSCMYALRQGQIRTMSREKKEPPQRFFIKSGIALVESGSLNVLVERY